MDFINNELVRVDCRKLFIDQIDNAAEEIFLNIINYAYKSVNGDVMISISAGGDEAEIRFEDTGIPFDPLKLPDPDLSNHLEDQKKGGLGVFIVKKLMDKVDYKRTGEKNILTIVKKIK